MKEEIVELKEDVSGSSLYSEDLAPVPADKRTWSMWNLTFIWVGMAVCIPTYMLASYMMKSGLSWWSALIIIGLANLAITVPMALNGHAGVKYGIPFPVQGRSSFGFRGIHLPAIVRAIVACGWFGIQTWIGGLAFYAIFNAATGSEPSLGLDAGKFIGFGLFWLMNMYFVWKGTESIKWLEEYSAPILVLMGILLIGWGATQAGGFGIVLDQSKQLEKPVAEIQAEGEQLTVDLHPIRRSDGTIKATEYKLALPGKDAPWTRIESNDLSVALDKSIVPQGVWEGSDPLSLQFRAPKAGGGYMESSVASLTVPVGDPGSPWWGYVIWFTAMVGFWATMSISIADITRYTSTQKAQVGGQLIGLPGTMILYSFVGIFVTCAAVINFDDVLMASDAPWDPVSLLAKFQNPWVVIVAQIFMVIATLSTNIAANVIAPANAFSNLRPKSISFKTGGTITGIIGILICPWWLMDEIGPILIFVSGLLGPVVGILICDYYLIRKTKLKLADLFKTNGIYSFQKGINPAAVLALVAGVVVALIGLAVPALGFLYKLSWFAGFFAAFFVYWAMMRGSIVKEAH